MLKSDHRDDASSTPAKPVRPFFPHWDAQVQPVRIGPPKCQGAVDRLARVVSHATKHTAKRSGYTRVQYILSEEEYRLLQEALALLGGKPE